MAQLFSHWPHSVVFKIFFSVAFSATISICKNADLSLILKRTHPPSCNGGHLAHCYGNGKIKQLYL